MISSSIVSKSSVLLTLLIVGFMTALIIESSQPPLPLLGFLDGFDKIAHFLAFAFLNLLICTLFLKVSNKEKVPLFSTPLLITSLFGIIEESYQTFIPTRTSSLYDLLADILGAIFDILIANQINAAIHRKSKKIKHE